MTEGELVSLRLFVAAPEEAQQELWREGVAMASMPIEFETGDAIAAKVALGRGGIDVCVLDDALGDADAASVVRAARRNEPAPLLVLSSADATRRAGLANVLGRPANAADACKLVEICIRVKMPVQVLVADDSDTMRSLVCKILGASRFELEVHEAADSTSALGQLRIGDIGLVFLDYDMPGLNGSDVLLGIKRESPHTKIVMMAKATQDDAASRRRLAGTLGLLKKPFYPADVDAVLARYLGLHGP